ncbi:hypothetical protein BT67DRAFT_183198 [Trichocladium antarcticum]|uniref:Uncharacterized protein n=1 Tax=Trichocladium antarcticum TaxID=1450529 RepID=A0AAN6ZGD4_9PEZI|nr:hypothetical protein BT67DRAFT_183198 [Trichocladium antarcticum]
MGVRPGHTEPNGPRLGGCSPRLARAGEGGRGGGTGQGNATTHHSVLHETTPPASQFRRPRLGTVSGVLMYDGETSGGKRGHGRAGTQDNPWRCVHTTGDAAGAPLQSTRVDHAQRRMSLVSRW